MCYTQFVMTNPIPHQFSVGEEVLYDEERYIISAISAERKLAPYRLLACQARGTSLIWAPYASLMRIDPYLQPRFDTGEPENG